MTDYCRGFAYPIPTSFYDALVACRFEQGDLLYTDAIAYEASWGEALRSLNYMIQVTAPIRGSVASGGEKQRDGKKPPDQVFRDNSETEVSFELTDVKADKKTSYTTTQGQLYTAIRSGDLSALECQFNVPMGLRDANKLIPSLSLRTYAGDGRRLFAFFGLLGTDLLYNKLEALQRGFGEEATLTRTHVSEIKELADEDMNPMLELYAYALNMSEDEIDEAAKSVLYKPSKDKKTDRENWRLATHGYLEEGDEFNLQRY
jgi:hypothetical protein